MARQALSCWLTLIVLVVLSAAPVVAASSPLTLGAWEGSITEPEGTVEPVLFEVSKDQGELRLEMVEDGGRVQFTDVGLEEGGDLVFSWRSGDVTMDCRLEPRADGGFAGECSDLLLAMSPPQE